MSQTSQISETVAEPIPIRASKPPLEQVDRKAPIVHAKESSDLFLPILTASLTIHLLITAFVGAGVTQNPPHPKHVTPPPLPAIIEDIKIVEEPVLPPPPQKQQIQDPTPDSPEPAAPLDLPPLPQVQPIAAVSALTPVSFGLAVNGPVRLVSDASRASGGGGGRRQLAPITIDSHNQHDLLISPTTYPYEAKRHHWTGTVLVQFKTSPTGDISDVHVAQSSGYDVLDYAATETLRRGRWSGEPGIYQKAFEFSLK